MSKRKPQTLLYFADLREPMRIVESVDYVAHQMMTERPFWVTAVNGSGKQKRAFVRCLAIARVREV